MALVTLILQDLEDGNVSVHAHCEPALAPGGQPTKAQSALMLALNAIDDAARAAAPGEAPGTLIEG